MTVPEDAGQVMTAMKLGWFIAEVRGRNRPDAPRGTKVRPPGPPGHALPLRIEQTSTELRIEAQAVLGAMARGLGVDGGGANQASYSRAIDAQAEALARARAGGAAARVAATPNGAAQAGAPGPGAAAAPDGEAAPGAAAVAAAGDPDAQWDALQELIFKFDEHIQDTLASGSDTVACGYQLGRALAESYWALAPALDTDKSPAVLPEAGDFLRHGSEPKGAKIFHGKRFHFRSPLLCVCVKRLSSSAARLEVRPKCLRSAAVLPAQRGIAW